MKIILSILLLMFCSSTFAFEDGESAITMYRRIVASFNSEDYITTISECNNFLLMQPNEYTELVSVTLGLSNERIGNFTRAKIEYNVFLKLYPNSKYYNRVKLRLDKINSEHPEVDKPEKEATVEHLGSESYTTGYISSYFVNNEYNKLVNQTNYKISTVFREDNNQQKLVHKYRFDKRLNQNLYYEYLNLGTRTLVRVGRQDTPYLSRTDAVRVDLGREDKISIVSSGSIAYEKNLNTGNTSSIWNIYYTGHSRVGSGLSLANPNLSAIINAEEHSHNLVSNMYNLSYSIYDGLVISSLYNRRYGNVTKLVGLNYSLNSEWTIYTNIQSFNNSINKTLNINRRGEVFSNSIFINSSSIVLLNSYTKGNLRIDLIDEYKKYDTIKLNYKLKEELVLESQYNTLGSSFLGIQINF
jgi:hypothetical protein